MRRRRRFLIIFAVALILLSGSIWWQVHRWEKEAFALAKAGQTVASAMGDWTKALKVGDTQAVLAMIDEAYENPTQGDWQESLSEAMDEVRIYSWAEVEPRPFTKAEMDRALTDFLASFEDLDYAKFKLLAIDEAENDRILCRGTLWLRGTRTDNTAEVKAAFRLTLIKREDQWRIARQSLLSGQTVVGPGTGFTDVALSVGLGDFRSRINPDFATEAWFPKAFEIAQYSSPGISATDFDGDGWTDLFLANGEEARLYRNLGGHFQDVTQEAGLAGLHTVNVAIFADFDNDGDQDLFLGRFTEANLLFRNNGDGTFERTGEDIDWGGRIVAVAGAGDYDNDGDLDLYLGRYLDPRVNLPTTPFYTRNSEGNSLMRNDGGLRFTNVTETAGVREGGLTLGVVWGDIDGDHDQDLYVANDFGRNALFRNNGDGTFTDIASQSDALDMGYGMSATFGDVDDDGDLDIYVANVHSGQRWYGQAPTLKNYLITSIRSGTLWEDLPVYRQIRRHLGSRWSKAGDHIIRGNSLLLNDGDGSFRDVSVKANANPFGWYWGSTMWDFDNDGDKDIYSANGWISAHNIEDY